MSHARIVLQAVGSQDAFLTKNSKHTHFKKTRIEIILNLDLTGVLLMLMIKIYEIMLPQIVLTALD